MELPKRDVVFLTERGFSWETIPDPSSGLYLIIKNFDVSGGGFTPSETTLMIRIPQQYPMTPLDMWYCDPPLRLAATGQYAVASEIIETHLGINWQRFSRHLNNGWQPGVDSIRSFFTFIQKEMQGKGQPT